MMKMSLRMLEQKHPDTLISIANLASTYGNQEQWKKAEELKIQMIETRKRMLRQKHPDILTSIVNLMLIYRNQERWKKTEELFV